MWMQALLFVLSLFGAQNDDARADAVVTPAAAKAAPAKAAPAKAAPAKAVPARRAPAKPAPAPARVAAAELPALPVVALAQTADGKRLDADSIVGKVQAFYNSTKGLKATFRQTVTNATFGRTTVSSGRVYLEKPGKMRWDYYRKQARKGKPSVSKAFVSDGKRLWAVFVDDKQYYEKDLSGSVLPVAVTFLTGQGDLRRDFHAALDTKSKWGAKGDYVLELTPKKPSAQYKKLWLVVDPSNFRVKQSVVLNSAGDTNEFRFYEPKTDEDIADTLFVFNAKAMKGYRKIEAPKE